MKIVIVSKYLVSTYYVPGTVPALQTPALLGVNMDEQAMNRKHCKNVSRTVCGKAGARQERKIGPGCSQGQSSF